MMHYHGTPITPRPALLEMVGKNFCVSFSTPYQDKVCHQIGQSVMLDNGAFSVWRQGIEIDWKQWAAWVEPWLDYHTTWCVLPDTIDGTEDDNDRLLREYNTIPGVPVWHLHESLGRLQRLVADYGKVCFGSSGAFAGVGTDRWCVRVCQAFNAICEPSGRVPWVHMLRGMSLSGQEFPFASVDSTDIARNHHLASNGKVTGTPSGARWMADRWDQMQCPARWVPHEQLELVADGV